MPQQDALSRRGFLAASAAWAASTRLGLAARRAPNVILIVADDLGYAELGVQGSPDIPTPNIDSIARNGIRFTNGYVSCPVCSPTRAGLMTGRYQQRFGHEFNPGPPAAAADNFGLSLQETTLPQRMKSAGYSTGMVGKWHLGYKPEFHPQKRGFDEFFGFLGGAHSYLNPMDPVRGPILRGVETVNEQSYLTDAFRREALAYLDRHRKEPFFLYLAFNAVHAPLETVAKYRSRFPKVTDPRRQTFAAMLSAMDDAVGDVLHKVREAKLEQDTLICFVSDNGGPTPSTTSSNVPLRGYKGQVWEGGIRVPYLMQWNGHLPAGKVCDAPVISLDLHATAAAAAGGTRPGDLDGVNLLPYLTGAEKSLPHDRLFWRFGAQRAVREGDWKLVMLDDEQPQLFNLAKDIGESRDLAAEEPARVKDLKGAYDTWNAQLAEPKWGRGNVRRGGKKRNRKR